MDNIIWFITTIPCSALITGFGIYAWNRKTHVVLVWLKRERK